jgi:hypothetical protein
LALKDIEKSEYFQSLPPFMSLSDAECQILGSNNGKGILEGEGKNKQEKKEEWGRGQGEDREVRRIC